MEIHPVVFQVGPAEISHDLDDWRASIRRLLELEADILCEGHFGIYRSQAEVRQYMKHSLRQHGKYR